MKLTRAYRSGSSGSALVVAILLTLVLSGMVLVYLSVAVDTQEFTTHEEREGRLEAAADSAVQLAVHSIWSGFEQKHGLSATKYEFRDYLESDLGLADQSSAEDPKRKDYRDTVKLPTDLEDRHTLSGVTIDALELWREDTWNGAHIVVEAAVSEPVVAQESGEAGTLGKRVRQVWAVEAPQWEGLNYALLSNNINCIMCHAEVDVAERVFNQDPTRFGTFDRVRIGSLESFQLRSDPESWIAGTLYLAGSAVKADGSPITDWNAGGFVFDSCAFDSQGKLEQDPWGELSKTPFSPAGTLDPQAFENLYVGYEKEVFDDVDGVLPTSFPSPFPDDGGYDSATGAPTPEYAGNRKVDANEFLVTVKGSTGTITGGSISVLEPGKKLTTAAELASFLGTPSAGALTAVTSGNVYLQGTEENPILLNGNLAIDGDLIIEGVVKGIGSLKVSGNVYVPSDLVYADGKITTGDGDELRNYGTAMDGSDNVFGLAAGGNVMIGDIFRPAWGSGTPTNGSTSGSFNFIMEELALFNRMEWIKTQPTLPGKSVTTKTITGYTTKTTSTTTYASYTTVTYTEKQAVYTTTPDGYKILTGYKTVTKTKKVGVGDPIVTTTTSTVPVYTSTTTTPAYPNPSYKGPGYLPRYYGFTKGSTVPVFNKGGYFDPAKQQWIAPERAGAWTTSYLTYANPANTKDPLLYDATGQPKAVVSTLTATGGWMSDTLLRTLQQDAMKARDASEDFEVDGLIYSNNSIFGMMPARSAPGSNGRMSLNGGIVAADIGLLAPNGFAINYDGRARELLDISSDSELTIRRMLAVPMAKLEH